MGGPEMAPQAPQRSALPGQAVARLERLVGGPGVRSVAVPTSSASGQEIFDSHHHAWDREGSDSPGGRDHLASCVAPTEGRLGNGGRLAVYLQGAVDQVEHPVVGQARPGVEATLPLSRAFALLQMAV